MPLKQRWGSNMSVEGELALASMDPNIPTLDLHGLIRDAVSYEVGMLIAKNPGACVRIIYGHGKGILKDAVTVFLKSEQEKRIVEGFAHEMSGSSCVVKIA